MGLAWTDEEKMTFVLEGGDIPRIQIWYEHFPRHHFQLSLLPPYFTTDWTVGEEQWAQLCFYFLVFVVVIVVVVCSVLIFR